MTPSEQREAVERLRYAREYLGLSQRALAKLTRGKEALNARTIADWEQGRHSPRISKLEIAARVMGLNAEWLTMDGGLPEDGWNEQTVEICRAYHQDKRERERTLRRITQEWPERIESGMTVPEMQALIEEYWKTKGRLTPRQRKGPPAS
ncbi:MAG TPA: helix-turn-helix transcriptional regulator [Candidatus Binatus sp.]|nr:helix-turn-helix transcriptional regulator [Candidatus Binatus sp.]